MLKGFKDFHELAIVIAAPILGVFSSQTLVKDLPKCHIFEKMHFTAHW